MKRKICVSTEITILRSKWEKLEAGCGEHFFKTFLQKT
jgi:hypothetical protein